MISASFPTELEPRLRTQQQAVDLEKAKCAYLAQWAHKGCGGAPLAYVRNGQLGCTGCRQTWPGHGALGEAVVRARDFVSLVVR